MKIDRFLPALPTLIVSAILAVDFAGIAYRMYLGIIVAYLVVLLIEIALLVFFSVKSKKPRSLPALSCLILLIATVCFLFTGGAAESLIRNHTSWNRIFAKGVLEFEKDDSYRFTIIGLGEGSTEDLSLNSGYTNIRINDDHTGGPSLNYDLQPELVFKTQVACDTKVYEKDDFEKVFSKKGLGDILVGENTERYLAVLKRFGQVSSVGDFEREFGEEPGFSISLIPFENATYRVSFAMLALGALVLSFLFTSKRWESAQDSQSYDGP